MADLQLFCEVTRLMAKRFPHKHLGENSECRSGAEILNEINTHLEDIERLYASLGEKPLTVMQPAGFGKPVYHQVEMSRRQVIEFVIACPDNGTLPTDTQLVGEFANSFPWEDEPSDYSVEEIIECLPLDEVGEQPVRIVGRPGTTTVAEIQTWPIDVKHKPLPGQLPLFDTEAEA